jgi:hypothetical protein
MKLTIRTRNRGRGTVTTETGTERREYKFESTCNMGETSYPSVKAMQKELMGRFPDGIRNRKNRKIMNGLVVREGVRNNRMTQVITIG